MSFLSASRKTSYKPVETIVSSVDTVASNTAQQGREDQESFFSTETSARSSADLQYLQQIANLFFVKFQVYIQPKFQPSIHFLLLQTTQIITMVNG